MSMKSTRIIVIAALAAALAAPLLFSQKVSVGEPNPAEIGKDQAQQLLKEVSVTKFEDSAFWYSAMPLDMGIVTVKRLEGVPAEKKPIEDEAKLGIKEKDSYVLGVKVNFFRRGESTFSVHPMNPIAVEGITKTISLWVVGRNYNHVLKLLFQDYFGNQQEITVGKLNFLGWKKLTVAIPPSITQSEYHYTYKNGIRITGLRVECDQLEAYGTYYLYLDDMRAVADLFGEAKRDSDDMADGW
jgi:hypothetical protein